MFKFKAESETGARIGSLTTPHGIVKTPLFMPVATQGTVKTLTFKEVVDLGHKALISNAFVLYLKPGLDTIKKLGGIHAFINWRDVLFTDSGGFQMLNPDFIDKTDKSGVVFRSPFDRSRHKITPESCMKIQNDLGSDVAMVLDNLIPFDSPKESQEKAVNQTTQWAKRCKEAHENEDQLIFAITQGGTHPDLRRKSARELVEIGFDGYAIGGLSIGEPKNIMQRILREQTNVLPGDKPRYLMGVGSPIELLNAISLGVDIFDSTFPTRNARHNDAYTYRGEINLSRGRFKTDEKPIEEECDCYTCINHSRAYINHLLKNREVTGQSLMTIHNLYFINRLLRDAKNAIQKNGLTDFMTRFKSEYGGGKDEG